MKLMAFGTAAAVAWFAAGVAHAQEPAAGIMKHDAATAGATDVAAEGFQAVQVPKEEESKDATELKLTAGGLLSTGNSRSMSGTASGRFRARRDDNQLTLAVAGNYSRAAPDRESAMETSVENVQGNERYDRFIGKGFALFLSASERSDRFQGLDLRINLDPGLAYYFIDDKAVQLWTEIGYDLQYDVRRGANLRAAAADGDELERTDVRHSARLFGGYSNSISAAVVFFTGLEYLQGLPDTEYWRLNWDVGFSSSLSDRLSLATTFSLRYDNHPLPDIAKTDTMTSLSVVYQAM